MLPFTWEYFLFPHTKGRTYIEGVLQQGGEEMASVWRRLHNKELRNFYYSPYIIRVIKSRSMRLAGHIAHMGRIEKCTRFDQKNRRENSTLYT